MRTSDMSDQNRTEEYVEDSVVLNRTCLFCFFLLCCLDIVSRMLLDATCPKCLESLYCKI